MRKIVQSLFLGSLIAISPVVSVYADGTKYIKYEDCNTLRNGSVSRGVATPQTRGQVISTGLIEISDLGGGEIGVYMQTLTHVDVDETDFTIFLDQWSEKDNKWINLNKYSFNYKKEDYPDENLSIKDVSFSITDQLVGSTYRLRGFHIVKAGSIRESLVSQTDGIVLTK